MELLSKIRDFAGKVRTSSDRFKLGSAAASSLQLSGGAQAPLGQPLFWAKSKRKAKAQPPQPVVKKVRRKAATPPGATSGWTAALGAKTGGILDGWLARLSQLTYDRADWSRLAVLVGGMLIIVLFSFSAGGYFLIRRSYGELGLLYLLVIGLLFSFNLSGRLPRWGVLEFGCFGGFSLWVLLSTTWSSMPARTFDEFTRTLMYLAGMALFYLYLSRREWLSWLGHLFVAIVVIVAVNSLLGKIAPDVIKHPDPFASNRLSYPLTYWNTLALFMVMAFPLALRVAARRATPLLLRCVTAGALYLFAVILFFTLSRASMLLLVAVLGIYLLVAVERLRAVLQSALALFWTGVLIAACYLFLPAMVERAPGKELLISQGHTFGWVFLLLLLLAAVATQLLLWWWDKRFSLSARQSRGIGWALTLAAALVLLGGGGYFIASQGGPVTIIKEQLEMGDETFSRAEERLLSLQSDRFREYAVSVNTFLENPIKGTGSGTWQIRWNMNRVRDNQVKDGHSLFFENLAELGLVGIILLFGFIAAYIIQSIKDLRFLGKSEERELYGAFFTAGMALLLHAQVDWDWEMPVVFLSFFFFAGALLRYGMLARAEQGAVVELPAAVQSRLPRWLGWKWLVGFGCVIAMLLVIFPLLSATGVRSANELAVKNNFPALEREARSAHRFNPLETEALALQAHAAFALNKPDEAESLLKQAIELEPYNDRVYRNLSRLYLQTGRIDEAADAVRKSREINPLESKETGELEQKVRAAGGKL